MADVRSAVDAPAGANPQAANGAVRKGEGTSSGTANAPGWMRGVVKAVPSADRVVIMGLQAAGGGIPAEKELALAGLSAPRLRDNRREDSKDDPLAWEAREYLRKLCIGHQVVFKINYRVDSISRDFGTVFVGGEDVAMALVKMGFAKSREGGKSVAQEMLEAEEAAKASGKGLWASGVETKVRPAPPPFEAKAFLGKYKGKDIAAVVEGVISGNSVRVTTLPEYYTITLFLAGVQCPSLGRRGPKKTAEDGEQDTASAADAGAEPFAKEARYFTELKTLSRDVRFRIEGLDKYGNLYGALTYLEGTTPCDLATSLCGVGVAKVVDWSIGMVASASKIRAAEKAAKDGQLRLWRGYVAPQSLSAAIVGDAFVGKVVEVVSGDTLVVHDTQANVDRRVVLSSIRAPRVGRGVGDPKAEPWSVEAKEFVRGRVIGKDVSVKMDYSRRIVAKTEAGEADPATPERVMLFGTVTVKEKGEVKNLAEVIVARGLASVVKHRGEEERSPVYDDLLAAEVRANKSKKGVHSSKDPPKGNVQDLSRGGKDSTNVAKRARELLPFLQQKDTHTAIVDYVLNGHRFKLHLPKENAFIAFSLAGVRCPGQGEPFSEEAVAFARHHAMQREVEIEIEALDKVGTFIGQVKVDRMLLSAEILRKGYGKLHPSFSSDRSNYGPVLTTAEKSAKQDKKGLWEGYDESQEAAAAEESTAGESTAYDINGLVTHIVDASTFYIQEKGQANDADSIATALGKLSMDKGDAPNERLNNGTVCAAKFSYDQQWYRAKVQRAVDGGKAYEVNFIDFGNGETVTADRVRTLDVGVASRPAQASLCTLAFLKVPSLEAEYGYEAASVFNDIVRPDLGEQVRARVEFTDKVQAQGTSGKRGKGELTRKQVTLFAKDGSINVNETIVKEGFAQVDRRRARSDEALKSLISLQEMARESRSGMWEYGDIDDDEA